MGLRITKPATPLFSGLQRPGVGQAAPSVATQDAQALQSSQMVAQATQAGVAPTREQVAEAGAAMTAQAGKAQAQATAAQSQQALQAQELEGRRAVVSGQQALRERALGLRAKERDLQSKLYSLNSALAGRLFEDQMKFQKDELGRTVWQTRQLVDWAVAKAKGDEDIANFEMNLTQQYKRKMQILQAAHARITQALQQEYTAVEQEKDQALKIELDQKRQALENKMKKEQAEANMWGMIISEGAGIIAGGAALYFSGGNPMAAGTAYTAGKGAGTLAYGIARS